MRARSPSTGCSTWLAGGGGGWRRRATDTAAAEPATGVRDDADPAGDLEVAHHHVCVLRRPGGYVKRADHIDGPGGDGCLGVLGGRADHDDRSGPVGHDPFDRLEAT